MSQSERQIAAGQRRSLRAMREKLLAMAEAWDCVDQFNQSQLVDLADQVEKVGQELVSSDDEAQP